MQLDHVIQVEIAKELAQSDTPLSFTQLKPQGMENSLFMYHARKLLSRAIIEKVANGYALTREGAVWLNEFGISIQTTRNSPRALISLVVQSTDGRYLISTRSGQMNRHLNSYLLPGTQLKKGKPIDDQITFVLNAYGLSTDESAFRTHGFVETLFYHADKYAHHSLVYVVSVSGVDAAMVTSRGDEYGIDWMTDEEVASEKVADESPYIAHIVTALTDGTLPERPLASFIYK